MSQTQGLPVIVEYKPGANGIVGATYAAQAAPDGLTYFVGATGPLSLNVPLRDNLAYGMDSFVPVCTMMSGPLTITVPLSMGVSNIDALVAFARERGTLQRYATLGPQVGGRDAMQAQRDWDVPFWGGVIEANNITLE